jgi:D-alanine-D-alanine ligase-like ATP-grasp enzyme
LEIESASSFYDEDTKLTGNGTQYHYPARISEPLREQAREYCRELASSIGLTVYARFDFMATEDDRLMFLEINSLPGLSEASNYLECMKAVGLSYDETILALLRASLLDELDHQEEWR